MAAENFISVYFSSAGRRVELIRCFRESARELGLRLKVIAGDLAPGFSAACQEADVAVRVPTCNSPEFLDAVGDICATHGVKLIVPTIDPELLVLSRSMERFSQSGVTVAVSSPEVIELARNKRATAAWLSKNGIRTPPTVTMSELREAPDAFGWPAILKPNSGSGSKGIYIARSWDDIRHDVREDDAYIVQSLLIGREYTTNMFFDKEGGLRSIVPHLRWETRGGEVSKGETVREPALIAAAERLAKCLPGARGAICFQAIIDDTGSPSIFEINARFGGGYPLAHQSGAKFAKWLLCESTNRPVDYGHVWKTGVRMLRYDSAFFFEAVQGSDGEKNQ